MLQRRDLLRLLAATTLALLAFGAEGCGGGTQNNDSDNSGNGNAMADDAELATRLTTVRRLLDDAQQKYQTFTDPVLSAQLGVQLAIGNAVLVLAERASELSGAQENLTKISGSLNSISDNTDDINTSIRNID